MNRNNWLNGVTVNLLQMFDVPAPGSPIHWLLLFLPPHSPPHSNQHLEINAAEYPQTAESLFLRGNFQLLGANTFHDLGSHCSQNGLSKWQCAPGKSRSLHFSEKQRALIIQRRTLDNKFAIKMNVNGRRLGCFEASLPPLAAAHLVLWSSRFWRPCLPSFMLAMKQLLVPLETDSATLCSVASLYLMKGKSGNVLLMNLECKKK